LSQLRGDEKLVPGHTAFIDCPSELILSAIALGRVKVAIAGRDGVLEHLDHVRVKVREAVGLVPRRACAEAELSHPINVMGSEVMRAEMGVLPRGSWCHPAVSPKGCAWGKTWRDKNRLLDSIDLAYCGFREVILRLARLKQRGTTAFSLHYEHLRTPHAITAKVITLISNIGIMM